VVGKPRPAAMTNPATSHRNFRFSGAGAGRTTASTTAPVPASSRDGGTSAAPRDRFFVGRRPGPTEALVVSPGGVTPLVHYHRLGAYPFDWGSHGEGVYELAYGLLAELTGACPPAWICGAMEVEILAFLTYQGFTVHERDVDTWLGHRISDEQRAAWPTPTTASPAMPPPGPRPRRRWLRRR